MSSLPLDPEHAGPDDVCPSCGRLILDGHAPTCPFYDLLEAMLTDLWIDQLWRESRRERVTAADVRAFLTRIVKRLHPEYGPDAQQAWVESGMSGRDTLRTSRREPDEERPAAAASSSVNDLGFEPDDAESDDICPGCGAFARAAHPPSCPSYDLLDAITFELKIEETDRKMRDYCSSPEEFRVNLLRFLLEGMPELPPGSDEE